MIDLDSKNYHAWSYRQYLIKKFECYDSELEETKRIIMQDLLNNSAWNHRFFVIGHLLKSKKINVEDEFTFVRSCLELAQLNESVWNYISGLVKLVEIPMFYDLCKKYEMLDNRFALAQMLGFYRKKNMKIEYFEVSWVN